MAKVGEWQRHGAASGRGVYRVHCLPAHDLVVVADSFDDAASKAYASFGNVIFDDYVRVVCVEKVSGDFIEPATNGDTHGSNN